LEHGSTGSPDHRITGSPDHDSEDAFRRPPIAGTCNALVFNAVARGVHHRSMVLAEHAMV
jgi:hypothetical protein